MKTTLYMAATLNGIIAKEDDSADFLSPTEAASYVQTVIHAGALIIGRKTYEVLSKQPEFEAFLNAQVKIVAVSHHNELILKDQSHAIAHSPKEALALLKECDEVVIAGGAKLNASFLEEGLIGEIYIDIEPALMGKGIPLFNGNDFERKLEFLGRKMLSSNEIQLHYKVIS